MPHLRPSTDNHHPPVTRKTRQRGITRCFSVSSFSRITAIRLANARHCGCADAARLHHGDVRYGIGDVVTGAHTVSGHHRQYASAIRETPTCGSQNTWLIPAVAPEPLPHPAWFRPNPQSAGFKRTHVSQCLKASRNGFRHTRTLRIVNASPFWYSTGRITSLFCG